MKKGLILHAVLLLGNIGVFLGMAGGQSAGDGREIPAARVEQAYFQRPADPQPKSGKHGSDADLPRADAAQGGGLAAALEGLKQEQARLRDELARLKSPPDLSRVSTAQQTDPGSRCKEAADNSPGVTVYLETTPADPPQANGRQPGRQWTSVSFKEVGQAPDGSKQAVMSIQKTQINNSPGDFMPTRTASRWQ